MDLDKIDRMAAEKVMPIPGFQPYGADSLGNIYNLSNKWRGDTIRKLSHSMHDGYRRVKLRVGEKYVSQFVHVLVCAAFHGPRPESCNETRHLNGDKMDNRPENLKWGTTKENYLDRVKHGADRMNHGDAHNKYKMHCKRGHPYNDQNTYKDKRGSRVCRLCRAIAWRKHYGHSAFNK